MANIMLELSSILLSITLDVYSIFCLHKNVKIRLQLLVLSVLQFGTNAY